MKKTFIILVCLLFPVISLAKELPATISLAIGATSCQAQYLKPVPPKKGAVIFIQSKNESNLVLLPQLSQHFSKRGLAVLILDLRSFNNTAECALKEELIAALAFLKEQHYKKAAVLYYGQGAFDFLSSIYALTPLNRHMLKAMVLVSAYSDMSDYSLIISQHKLESQKQNRIPVFDIGAEFDYAFVYQSQEKRQNNFDVFGATYYRKLILPGASHDYMSFESPLANWASSYILARFKKQP